MSQIKITDMLEILTNLILTQHNYFTIFSYVDMVKKTNSNFINYYSLEGLNNLKLILENITIETKTSITEETINFTQEVNFFNELINISADFSMLSNLTIKEWNEFLYFVVDSNLRIYNSNEFTLLKSDRFINNDNQGLILKYPWFAILILFKLLDIKNKNHNKTISLT